MANLNKMLAMGNLTKAPDLRTTNTGSPVCELTIALNRDKNDVCYLDVVLWGKLAENSAKYLSKGSQAFIEGYLKQERWTDKQGNKHSKMKLVAETIQFIAKQNQEPSQAPNSDYSAPPPAQPKPQPKFYGYQQPEDNAQQENIPF